MVAKPTSSYPRLHVTCAEDKYVVSFATTLPFLTVIISQLTAVHRQIIKKNHVHRYVNYCEAAYVTIKPGVYSPSHVKHYKRNTLQQFQFHR